MKNKLSLTAIALAALMTACSSKNEAITSRIELPGTIDEDAFAANVESISVMNLEMGDDWTLADGFNFSVDKNYIYMRKYSHDAVTSRSRIICFDQRSGKKISSRFISGRGPGEISDFVSMYCFDDNLFVTDYTGIIRQYDHNCSFVGKLHEFDESLSGIQVLRLSNGKYALFSKIISHSDSAKPAVMLTDKSFNIKSSHFAVPQAPVGLSPGFTNLYYANNDTIRFFLSCDNHLYTLYGDTEQTTELIVPNPLTVEKAYDEAKTGMILLNNLLKYDGRFGHLCESGRFVLFGYEINSYLHLTMLDKRTNGIISVICASEHNLNNTTDIVIDLFNRQKIIYTDGKFIYAKCKNSDLTSLLEGHDSILDERLKKTQAEYRAYMERNAEYIKGLDDDERDAANVLLKIKLKD